MTIVSEPTPPAGAETRRGRLVLVVGPSGVGKDTLLVGARRRLAQDRRFVFPRRIITRPHDPTATEAHEEITEEEFERDRRAGAYLLSWWAHGLAYAIPGTAADLLDKRQIMVANVSRTVVADARRVAPALAVVHVTASVEVRATRLALRGREDRASIEARLRRQVDTPLAGMESIEIGNDGPVEEGVGRLVAFLESVAR